MAMAARLEGESDALHYGRCELLLRGLLTILLALQSIAAFLPGPSWWGLNHLAYVPLAFRFIWPLAAILWLWTPLCSGIGRLLLHRVAPILLGRRLIAYVVAPLIGGVLLYLLRCGNHFLGDGWLLGAAVAKGMPFHGYDFVDYHLHYRLFSALNLTGEKDALGLYAVSSVLIGIIYLIAVSWSARSLTRDPGKRLLIAGMLVFSAPLQMFMGYVESYSILMICVLLSLVTLILHYRRGDALIVSATWLGIGIFFHPTGIFLAPLLLVAVLCPPASFARPLPMRITSLILPITILPLLGILLLVGDGYSWEQMLEDFVFGSSGKGVFLTASEHGGLLTWIHWKDVGNLLMLLAPIPLCLLLYGLARSRIGVSHNCESRRPLSREIVVLTLGCIWVVILMSTINLKLGTVRDWDLFAGHAAIFSLAAYSVWSHVHPRPIGPRIIGMIAGALILLILPWFLVNASDQKSLQRFQDVIADQSSYARAYAHEEIGRYYRSKGMMDEAIKEYRISTSISRTNARVHASLGELLYREGHLKAARDAFERALALDSGDAFSLEMIAKVHADQGNKQEALACLRILAKQPTEAVSAAELHGHVAEACGNVTEAVEAFGRAYRGAPHRMDLAEDAALLLLAIQDPAPLAAALRARIEQDSDVIARALLFWAIWIPLRSDLDSLQGPDKRAAVEEAADVLDGIISDVGETPSLRSLRSELDARLITRPGERGFK